MTSMLFWAIWRQSCKNSTKWTEMNTEYCPFRDRATCKKKTVNVLQKPHCKPADARQHQWTRFLHVLLSITWENSILPLIKPSCAFVFKLLWSSIGSYSVCFPPPQVVPFTADVPTRNTLLSHQPHANMPAHSFINSIINFGTTASSHREARSILLPPEPNQATEDVKLSAVRTRGRFPALNDSVNRCSGIYLDENKLKSRESLCSINTRHAELGQLSDTSALLPNFLSHQPAEKRPPYL